MNVRNDIPNENSVIVQHPDYKTEIIQILRSNFTPKLMREHILDYHENDIAAAMELMNKDERKRFYSILDTMTLADILEYSEQRDEYISELSIRKRIDILSNFEVSTTVEYLSQIEKEERQTLLDLMDDEVKSEIKLLSSFDEDEIGSRMTTNYIAVRAGIGIKQAMHELIEQAADNDNITTLYVLDEEESLVGAIDLKDLIVAREGTDLNSITMTSYPYVYANEQIEDCIERIKDYSEDSIPVLDSNNKLKGVLTSQDITQLVDDELGEDYAKLAGLSAEEDLHEPLRKSIGKRLPWLVILLGLGLLVSSVVGAFEHVVAHLTLIVSFQSLILDMAGNVGTQSLAVTIRVLMDEKLDGKQKLYLVAKEARVGLANGFVLGVLSLVFIGLYLIVLKGQSPMFAFSVSLCTGIALLVSIMLSSITGTVVPIIFKKLKVDPAVASGPLITTVNDLVAVVTYYGLAWILLINILGL
ncbi:MAG: magnesium transporter [Lachnospiraceae bacterium]|nr:magnesium transporter [Lachnospiraceae bacterium]